MHLKCCAPVCLVFHKSWTNTQTTHFLHICTQANADQRQNLVRGHFDLVIRNVRWKCEIHTTVDLKWLLPLNWSDLSGRISVCCWWCSCCFYWLKSLAALLQMQNKLLRDHANVTICTDKVNLWGSCIFLWKQWNILKSIYIVHLLRKLKIWC